MYLFLQLGKSVNIFLENLDKSTKSKLLMKFLKKRLAYYITTVVTFNNPGNLSNLGTRSVQSSSSLIMSFLLIYCAQMLYIFNIEASS